MIGAMLTTMLTTIVIFGSLHIFPMMPAAQEATVGVYSAPETCSKSQTESVYVSGPNCVPRKTLIKLDLPEGDSNIIEVHPPEIEVARCGGVCHNRKCVARPGSISVRTVTVQFTYINKQSSLTHPTKCSTIQVEQHDECICGCDLKPEDCNEKQAFDVSFCKCSCTNWSEMRYCLRDRANREWDETTCSCKCKEKEKLCGTNYLYDSKTTCKCHELAIVNRVMSDQASVSGLGVAVGILAAVAIASIGTAFYYRWKVQTLKRYNRHAEERRSRNRKSSGQSTDSDSAHAASPANANHVAKYNHHQEDEKPISSEALLSGDES